MSGNAGKLNASRRAPAVCVAPGPRGRRRFAGASLAEFATVLPVFMLLTLGLLEMGRGVMVRQIMVNAAREGARQAVLPGASPSDVIASIENYLDAGSISGASKTVEVLDAGGNPITDLWTLGAKDRIEVRVSVPFDEVAWVVPVFMSSGNTLTTSVVMLKE